MSNLLAEPARTRKVLSLKLHREQPEALPPQSKYVDRAEAVYMVYGDGKDMPQRLYRADEAKIACDHARRLASLYGGRFYVMRAWRGFEGQGDE